MQTLEEIRREGLDALRERLGGAVAGGHGGSDAGITYHRGEYRCVPLFRRERWPAVVA